MNLQTKVNNTIKKIKLSKKKKILVALSGGKDSTVTAYLLHKFGYNITGFHIDLGMGKYSEKCLEMVEKLCNNLDIKLHTYNIQDEMGSSMCYLRTSIQEKQLKGKLKNCAICGVIKKWILNSEARKLKFDYIATGHNLDDEAQTYLLNVLKGAPKLSLTTGVITKNISDKKFIPRIKPLFYVAEDDIKKFSKKLGLPVNYAKCPCAIDSYRIQVREFMNTLKTKDKENIVKNMEKVLSKVKRKKEKILYCEICSEPTRKSVCKKCEIVGVR